MLKKIYRPGVIFKVLGPPWVFREYRVQRIRLTNSAYPSGLLSSRSDKADNGVKGLSCTGDDLRAYSSEDCCYDGNPTLQPQQLSGKSTESRVTDVLVDEVAA